MLFRSLPDDIYEKILAMLDKKGVLAVVDATKDLLLNVLKYHPFLIKPNNHELGELFGVRLDAKEDVVYFAKELQKKGARNVLVSMAEKGAVLVAEDGGIYVLDAIEGEVLNSVGAGDSMVAGFLAGYSKHKCYKEALYLGSSAGSASAFSDGLATIDKIEQCYKCYKEKGVIHV